ncbi:hypothetical protein BHM03_00018005 [Ensete ventricosum]|nr:hypothetical protein BHM03_00018005 [Ensete ventricosum]
MWLIFLQPPNTTATFGALTPPSDGTDAAASPPHPFVLFLFLLVFPLLDTIVHTGLP